jgi:hypothetical protein
MSRVNLSCCGHAVARNRESKSAARFFETAKVAKNAKVFGRASVNHETRRVSSLVGGVLADLVPRGQPGKGHLILYLVVGYQEITPGFTSVSLLRA